MANSNMTDLDNYVKLDLTDVIKSSLEADGVDPDQVNILSSTGLFVQGFNTLYDDVSMAVNNIKRESSLLYCTNSSSLYNQLVQVVNDISLSTPSKLKMYVEIPLDSIRLLGKKVQENTYEFEYTDKNIVVLDDLEFIPVIPTHYIRYTKNEIKDEVRAFYKNSDGEIINISTMRDRFENIATVAIVVEFKQVTKVVKEEVFSDAQLEKFLITTDDAIHDFSMTYKDNQASKEVPVGKRLFYTRGVGNYLEYRILANNKISIDHKYVSGGFKPSIGSILRVTLETTTGLNVKTSEMAKVKQAYPDQLKVNYYPYADLFESTGGRLAVNDKEYIRNYIIKLKGSRKRIDTEADMGVFLKNYEGSSVFQPKLIVNDVKARIFNIYTILSFKHKLGEIERTFTIPTDSATVNIVLNKLPNKVVQGHKWYCYNSNCVVSSLQDNMTFLYNYDSSVDADGSDYGDETSRYYYVSPFIYSYSEDDNFARSYLDAQYDELYPTVVSYDGVGPVPTRFINTNLRMNDYIDKDKKRVFEVRAQIRADDVSFVRDNTNFKATLEMEEIVVGEEESRKFEIPLSEVTDEGHDNIYNLIFRFTSDRHIFNREVAIKFNDSEGLEQEKIVNVTQNMGLKLYTIETIDDIDKPKETHVVTFSANVDIFREVTSSLWIQTNLNYNGGMDFVLMPLVSMKFYQSYKNKEKITEEVNNIFDFIKQEVYGELDMFSNRGFTIRDMQESLFTVSIKFAKTYGRSKFLNVGTSKTVPIKNLQLKPTLFIRKLEDEFDESAIASELNERLITHDYEMSDLHMSELVRDVLTEADKSVSILQFINFDQYPSDYHLIKRNELEPGNNDVPEIVSVEPMFDENLGIYNYKLIWKNI